MTSPPPCSFNWERKVLPSHTTTPKKTLWRELLHRDWGAARLRLTLYPGDAFYTPEEYDIRHHQSSSSRLDAERHGGVTTCLHVACRNRSPRDILELLLDIYPAATRRQDAEGWTPLHTHILHGSVGTMGNPSREAEFLHMFQLLLHMSLTRRVVRSIEYPPVSVASIHGHTTGAPLHLFCCHGHHDAKNELHLVQALVRADPSQVTRPDPNGCFPGTLLWRLYKNRCRRLREEPPSSDNGDPAKGTLRILFCFLEALWGKQQQTPHHTLHKVLEYQAKYAGPDRTDFVRLYLEAYPESLSCWDEGKLPLHVAAELWPRSVTRRTALMVWSLMPESTPDVADPLWRLGQAAPDAARKVDRRHGRLPLHYALTAPLTARGHIQQHQWTPPTCLEDDTGIDGLVQAHPMALTTLDPVTLLPAVGLVAWVASQVTVTSETALVGFLYSILRQEPCVLGFCRIGS
uniref:Uncharacterized protein n=1 Tax=Amphora coffeiformis TaxID=265554 RepID=A0A7S3KY97_9STRA|mmetsp:Transcript_8173/g.15837  ORF Transcript_8173/g.15837 Transcript_8173/m.15837 type:complete len:461 (-) Transcript_8173:119-1501(-)